MEAIVGYEGDVAAAGAGVAPPRNGVGTIVWLGPGTGMPPGYESSKMSSCAPSRKLYKSKYLGGE